MVAAFVRLGVISVMSIMLIVFTVFLVRIMGQQQAFAAAPHPWFEQAYWDVTKPSDICLKNSQAKAGAKLLVTTHFKDGDWWVECGRPMTLDQLLKSSDHPDWILRVKANDSTNLDKLVEIVSSHDAKKKFAFVSDSQRASRFLRKKGPQWLFAADPASLLRLQMFTSLWIETAMDFWPDFVMATNEASLPSHINLRMAEELIRRQKRIVWTSDENPVIPVQGRVSNH